ncbi:hypothetical protein HRbin40_01583 [bacterium HR40]|nr:hypothetical protein HRbin40_01583 [bacterium HR40]
MRQSFLCPFAVALGFFLASPAMAAITSSQLSVRVEVQTGCTVRDAALDFGTYIAGQSSPVVAQTDILVDNCPVGTVSLHVDGGGSGNVAKRQMTGENGEKLSYQLYQDPNLRTLLGTGRQAMRASLGSSSSVVFTIYGVVAGGQKVSPGLYSDTVVVTLDF